MQLTRRFAIAGVILLLDQQPIPAHHSFAAEFDIKKPVKVQGKVTKMEWVNPHSWLYLDVKDESGKVTNWHFELGSPNSLFRLGWKKDIVPKGLEVVLTGYQAKTGEPIANMTSLKLPDGRELFAGGSNPDQPSGAQQ